MARTLDRPRRLRRLRIRGHGSDDGFILLESMIAITLITVIMGAVGMEYVGGLVTTGHQRNAAAAVRLADTAVDAVRALDPSDLLTGRDCQSVADELDTLSRFPRVSAVLDSVNAVLDPVNQPCQSVNQPGQLAYDASATYLAYDASATYPAGASAGVPTAPVTQPAAGTLPAFTVYDYLECAQPAVNGACLSTTSSTSTTVRYLRLAAAVVWTERGCPSGGCSYVTVSLINANPDPTFQTTQSLTPAPVIAQPADQTVVVGDSVSLQLAVRSGTGAPPLRWSLYPGSATTPASANLPAGLNLDSSSGLIRGTVQGSASGPTAVTVQVSDSVSRPPATATFSWTVKDKLAFVPVPAQATITTDQVSTTVSATGGIGPYTFSDPNKTLPAGLTLSSAGSITGTPSTPGNYPVTLTVFDSGNRSTTTTFQWTVKAPPMALSNPGPQAGTVNTAIAPLQLQVSGGDGRYQWSATGLPTGLALSSTGTVTGTPTTAAGPATVTVTVADPSANISSQQVQFTWTVYAALQITTPSAQYTPIGATVGFAVNATCRNAPCTYSAVNLPSGISVDATTGQISGTVAANASSTTHASVTITDHAGATATTADFTWIILPTADVTSTYLTALSAAPSVQVTYTCPNNPCTLTLGGSQVPGIGLSATIDTGAANTTSSLSVSGTTGAVYLTGIVARSTTTSSSTPVATPSTSAPASSAPSSIGGATTNAYTTAPAGTGGPTAPSSTTVASSTPTASTVAPSPTPAPTAASSTSASSTTSTYAMTVTITDKLGYTSSKQTTWTVRSEPAAGWPGDVSVVRRNMVAQAFAYSCQTTCTLSVTGTPTGIGLASAPLTTQVAVASVTVSGNGTYYLTGKVAPNAATGSGPVTLSMTESTTSPPNPVITSVGFWTVT